MFGGRMNLHVAPERMKPLKKSLSLLGPTIEEIMRISGTVGLSYGVLHRGEVMGGASFGYRSLEDRLAVDTGTIFPVCSLTKAMSATAVASLVEDGLLSWDTRVKDIIPEFETQSEEINENATISDFLSMRSGMHTQNLWLQSQNNIIFPRADGLRIYKTFKQTHPLRAHFQYDNWSYEIISQVIEQVTGQSWGVILRERIFKPLGMRRTDCREELNGDANITSAYSSLDNAMPVQIDRVKLSEATLMGAAGGVRSCVDELLIYYGNFLKAYTDQSQTGRASTPDSPFKHVLHQTSPHISIPIGTGRGISLDQAYGLGWLRGKLPGIMGALSSNRSHLGETPIIGADGPERLVLSHPGSMAGAFCTCVLFPDTETAVVVLTNTLPLSDAADWVSQLLTTTIFGSSVEHDFVQWTKRTVDAEVLRFNSQVSQVVNISPVPCGPFRDLEAYCGMFRNVANTLFLEVTSSSSEPYGSLVMRLQGLPQEDYKLKRVDNDVFTWLEPRNKLVARGRFTNYDIRHYYITFRSDSNGNIDALEWAHITLLTEAEIFWKDTSSWVR